ncbi:MAG TPA: response regulator [Cytophagaceae bacterium]|jgi:CheY-like chemotaxis protein
MSKINCVLLVDDDGATNFLNETIVKKMNISDIVHSEINGEKGLNFLQYYAEQNNNNAPELILLDLRMPVMDGIEFLQYLRLKKFDNKDNIKILVLANSDRPEELKKFEPALNIFFLDKPLTSEKLKKVVTSKKKK